MTIKNTFLLTALTPISHGDTQARAVKSNSILFMRQGAVVNGKSTRIPAISENALRAVLFRGPLHDDLLSRLEIQKGTLPQSVVNLLFAGGSLLSGAKVLSDEMALGHALKSTYPSLDLLGGAVDSFILPRSRLKMSAYLVAQEYIPALREVAPHLVDDAAHCSAFDLVHEETRIRGTGDDVEGNQMMYTYETLASGTKVFVEVCLDPHTSETTQSAVSAAMEVWDGFIGGQNRQGRGRMAFSQPVGLVPSSVYFEYIKKNREMLRDGLMKGTFGTAKVLCA